MAYAVHFINLYKGAKPRNLTPAGNAAWRTCCWALPAGEDTKLEGGWVYLHEKKGNWSYFGGKVTAVESIIAPQYAHE